MACLGGQKVGCDCVIVMMSSDKVIKEHKESRMWTKESDGNG